MRLPAQEVFFKKMIPKSISRYCSEDASNIENYDLAIADKTRTWDCHHRLEIQPDGTEVSSDELRSRGMYYHRPSNELIFLTKSEHTRLHMSVESARNNIGMQFRGKHLSEEHRRKLSESHKGQTSAMKGKTHSLETRKIISDRGKGRTPPNKGVPMSDDQKTKLSESLKNYFSNDDNRRKQSDAHKGKKHSEETKRKMSEAHKEYWEKKRMTKE